MSTCPECGTTYSAHGGGHCRGGAYGGCCRTFRSDGSFDAHRVGPFSARGCLPVDGSDLWRLTDRGWTHYPPMDSVALQRRRTSDEGRNAG